MDGGAGAEEELLPAALARALRHLGDDLLEDPRRLHGMLVDELGVAGHALLPGLRAVVQAAEEGVATDLRDGLVDDAGARSHLEAAGLPAELAAATVTTWRRALAAAGSTAPAAPDLPTAAAVRAEAGARPAVDPPVGTTPPTLLPPWPAPRVATPRGRRPVVLGLAVTAVVVALVAGVLVATRGPADGDGAATATSRGAGPASTADGPATTDGPTTSGPTSTTAATTTTVTVAVAATLPPGPAPVPVSGGVLAGMRGVVGMNDWDNTFLQRLFDTSGGWSGAGPAYDATVLAALATLAAGTDGTALGAEVVELSRGGTRCTSFVACAPLLAADPDADVDYDGVSGSVDLSADGDLAQAQFGWGTFVVGCPYDPTLVECVDAPGPVRLAGRGDDTSVARPGPGEPRARPGDGELRVVVLSTEDFLLEGPAVGARFAADDVNAAGGVLGRPVVVVEALVDRGRGSDLVAAVSAAAEGADVVVAALLPGEEQAAMSAVTALGVAWFSAADSGMGNPPAHHGLLFRPVATAAHEGVALATMVADGGHASVVVLADATTRAAAVAATLEPTLAARGVRVVGREDVDFWEDTVDRAVEAARASGAEAVVLIGESGVANVVRAMLACGFGPGQVWIYGGTGVMYDYLHLDVVEG